MNNPNLIVTDATITAFLDGELDDQQMALVRALIVNNPQAFEKYILMQEITCLVKEAFK